MPEQPTKRFLPYHQLQPPHIIIPGLMVEQDQDPQNFRRFCAARQKKLHASSELPSAPSRKFQFTLQLLSALPRKYIYVYTHREIYSFDILSVQTPNLLREEEAFLADVVAYLPCFRKILLQKLVQMSQSMYSNALETRPLSSKLILQNMLKVYSLCSFFQFP